MSDFFNVLGDVFSLMILALLLAVVAVCVIYKIISLGGSGE